MYVKLSDGTKIDNCLDGTTSDYIIHGGETNEEAVSILDVISEDNTNVIEVFNDNGTKVDRSSDTVLLKGAEMNEMGAMKVCIVRLRHKTDIEKMQDEIAELQEVIIEEG